MKKSGMKTLFSFSRLTMAEICGVMLAITGLSEAQNVSLFTKHASLVSHSHQSWSTIKTRSSKRTYQSTLIRMLSTKHTHQNIIIHPVIKTQFSKHNTHQHNETHSVIKTHSTKHTQRNTLSHQNTLTKHTQRNTVGQRNALSKTHATDSKTHATDSKTHMPP